MSRLIGYICNDDSLTPRVVEEIDPPFGDDERAGRSALARGFGWVRDGQALLRKRPPQGREHNRMDAIFADIQARQIVGYECAPERSTVETQDLQPFCFRDWIYAQSGDADALSAHREDIVSGLPDHIRRNLDGNSASELAFHLFVAALQRHEGLDLARREHHDCAVALAEAGRRMREFSSGAGEVERPPEVDAVAISEQLLVAWAGRGDLYYREFEGFDVSDEDPLFAGHDPESEGHPHFRAVLVATAESAPSPAWTAVDRRTTLWVDDDWEIRHLSAP